MTMRRIAILIAAILSSTVFADELPFATNNSAPQQKTVVPVKPAGQVAASVPAPVVNVVPAAPATDTPALGRTEAMKMVRDWAKAWSSRDVDSYLSFYGTHFSAPGGNRQTWEKSRREKIEAASKIDVHLEGLKIDVSGNHATATFQRGYRINTKPVTLEGTLELEKDGARWVIAAEKWVTALVVKAESKSSSGEGTDVPQKNVDITTLPPSQEEGKQENPPPESGKQEIHFAAGSVSVASPKDMAKAKEDAEKARLTAIEAARKKEKDLADERKRKALFEAATTSPARGPHSASSKPMPGLGKNPNAEQDVKPIVIHATSGVNEMVPISAIMPNMIVTPFDKPDVVDMGGAQYKTVGKNVFVVPTKDGPIGLYIIDKENTNAPAISLTLVPNQIPSQNIIVQLDSTYPKGKKDKAEDEDSASDYVDIMRRLMRKLAKGVTPNGYTEENMQGGPEATMGVIRIIPEKRLAGAQTDIYIYRLVNAGKKSIELSEQSFYQKGVKSVAFFPNIKLDVGAMTKVFVVAGKVAPDEGDSDDE